MAVSGAIGTCCPISIGKSFTNERVLCFDEHDVVGVEFFLLADRRSATGQIAKDDTDGEDVCRSGDTSEADFDNSSDEEMRESSPEPEDEPDDDDALELSVAGASQPAKEALPSRWWCFSACRPRRRCESPYCLWHQPS